MKIKSRYIIGFLLFLAAAGFIVYGVYEIRLLNPNRNRDQIIQWVESRYNLKFHLGLILPIMYPGLGFELNDVELLLPDPDRVRPELFRAKSLKAVINLKELYGNKRIQVTELIFIEPEFYYEWSPKEKDRYRNLKKPKTPNAVEQEIVAKQSLARKVFNMLRKKFPVKFVPEDLLNTSKIVISDGRFAVYDRRDRPNRIPPVEFAGIDVGIDKDRGKNDFIYWVETSFPFSEKGPPGFPVAGKGKINVSLKPFDMKINSTEMKWGEYPFKQLECEVKKGETRLEYQGLAESEIDLKHLSLILDWPPLKKFNKIERYHLEGRAEYRVRFQSGSKPWERFFIEQVKVNDFGVVLIDPEGKKTKLRDKLMFKHVKILARDFTPNKPVYVQMQMPFPYQEPLNKLAPFPLFLEGRLRFDEKFSQVSFRADKGAYGDNQFDQLDLNINRSRKPVSIKGSANIRINDLSQFRQLINWRIVPATKNVFFMDFSGKGRVILDFHFPEPGAEGADRFKYQGLAKLWNLYYDPGSVIAPIEGFNGELAVSDEKISMPVYWFKLDKMPIQSDLMFSRKKFPHFEFHTTANELDLAKLFLKRNRPPDPNLLPGSTLGPMRTVYVGDFEGQRLKYKKMVFDEAKGRWKHKDRVLGFNNFTLKYYKGWYQDNGSWIDFRRAQQTDFHVSGHFENFPLKKMMDELFGFNFFVDGRGTGEGYLSGAFKGGKFDYQTLNGHFKLQAVDGTLIGYNLGVRILQFLGFKIDEKLYGLDFEKGKAELAIKNGVIHFNDLSIRSWNLEAHAAGKVDMVQRSVNIWVAVYPLKALSTLTQPLPLIGALINQTQQTLFGSYAKAEGPWTDIKINVYLPLAERVPSAPPAPEFPARPWP